MLYMNPEKERLSIRVDNGLRVVDTAWLSGMIAVSRVLESGQGFGYGDDQRSVRDMVVVKVTKMLGLESTKRVDSLHGKN